MEITYIDKLLKFPVSNSRELDLSVIQSWFDHESQVSGTLESIPGIILLSNKNTVLGLKIIEGVSGKR